MYTVIDFLAIGRATNKDYMQFLTVLTQARRNFNSETKVGMNSNILTKT